MRPQQQLRTLPARPGPGRPLRLSHSTHFRIDPKKPGLAAPAWSGLSGDAAALHRTTEERPQKPRCKTAVPMPLARPTGGGSTRWCRGATLPGRPAARPLSWSIAGEEGKGHALLGRSHTQLIYRASTGSRLRGSRVSAVGTVGSDLTWTGCSGSVSVVAVSLEDYAGMRREWV